MERRRRATRTPRAAQGRGQAPLEGLRRVLMADADAAVLLLDPRGRVRELNPAAERLLSLRRVDALGTAGAELIRTVVPGEDPLRDAGRAAHSETDVVLSTPAGTELPVTLRSWRIGRPAWVAIVLRDRTQLRRMQQELRRHERLATLGQLSAGVAHEIRNPLAGIGTSAQVLLRRLEPGDERARFVTVILEEVTRLDRIVTSLLQYARPRTPELRPSALAPCIERVLQLAEEPIGRAGVAVEIDVAPRLGAVWIDADLVTQVLLNVTLNAVQAMPSGGRLRYEVRRLRRRPQPRGPGRRAEDPARRAADRRAAAAAGDGAARRWIEYQQIRVIDTGVGIPRGLQVKLFDPFFSTKAGGTGLGLSISQTIMQEHGGSIAVASREGRGTTVLLNFPVEKRHGERRGGEGDRARTGAARRR